MNHNENLKEGGGPFDWSSSLSIDDVDDLVLECNRLKASNDFLHRENSRLNAEIQRIYLESIY